MIRKRLTYANVVATIALFLALGGSSYALTVGSASIKNNSVRSVDVRNGTLRDRDVKRGALGARAIKESALGTVQSARTVNGTITAVKEAVVGTNAGASLVAECPGSYRALSGGVAWLIPGTPNETQADVRISANGPDPSALGPDTSPTWHGTGRNQSGGNRVLRVYAICVAE